MVCENELKAKREYGTEIASALFNRLADLLAAKSIFDVLVGKPTLYTTEVGHVCSIELGNNYVMILIPNHVALPLTSSRNVDWTKVTRIRVLKIDNQNLS